MSRPAAPASRRKQEVAAVRRSGRSDSVEDVPPQHRGQRDLGRRDGPEIVAFDVVGVLLELREMSGRHHGLGQHHGRRPDLLESVGVAVEGEGGQGPEQPGSESPVEGEHRPRELGPPLHVQDAQLRADLPVGDPLGLGVDGLGVRARSGPPRCPRVRGRRGRRPKEDWAGRGGPGGPRPGRHRRPAPRARSSSPIFRLRAASSSAVGMSPARRASPTCLERDLT